MALIECVTWCIIKKTSQSVVSDLKLNSDFVKGFGDDCDEDVLDHPCEEEDHGDEVEGGLPVLSRVACAVHDVDPALLTRGFKYKIQR